MLSKKVLPFVLVASFILSFVACRSWGKDGDLLGRQQKLLVTVGMILEQKHYNPRPVNDEFSKNIFKQYFNSLDQQKNIFLQSDIDSLKKYEEYLDDEIHGAAISFYPAVGEVYRKRVSEAEAMYKNILSKPFNFTLKESAHLEGDSINYPLSEAARQDMWYKRLKYATLERYAELLDQRDKSKDTDAIHKKTDAQLEAEARSKVLKYMDRDFRRRSANVSDEKLFNAYVNVITNEMDPHTDYLPPVEKRAFNEDMSNKFYGIGAQLFDDDGQIKVTAVIPGSPAFKSGQIVVNDIIVKVAQGVEEPVDVSGYPLDEAVKLIRGGKGSEVRLTLRKENGSMSVVSLIREEILQDEANARSAIIREGNTKIGYIWLPEFYADFGNRDGAHCAKDVRDEVEKLKAEKVDGLILDLRFNGGGSLYEVVKMVGLFVEDGPVVQVKDKGDAPSVLTDNSGNIVYNGPLTVMVNELSASASEIFAAAIQDYKRGVVVGSTSTFGKGTVQKSLPLGRVMDIFGPTNGVEYGDLKLTFEKFYRINGESTQLRGVVPDVIIPDTYEYMKVREKDSPTALAWDVVNPAKYNTWTSNTDIASIAKTANARVANSKAFNSIKENAEWLKKNVNRKYNLNLLEYKKDLKNINDMAKRTDSLRKLPKEMDIVIASADSVKFYKNPDQRKGDRYQSWLKGLKTDIYIDETARIIADMVRQKSAITVETKK